MKGNINTPIYIYIHIQSFMKRKWHLQWCLTFSVFLCWKQSLYTWGNPCQLAYISVTLRLVCVCRCIHRPLYTFKSENMCVQVHVMYEFKRLLLQLTTQTRYFLPPQEVFGEMPGIPPRKNRTDHGVASGSSVPHMTGHACTQVHAHNNTQLNRQTQRGRHKYTNWHIH